MNRTKKLDIATSQHQDNKQSKVFLKMKCQSSAESETRFVFAVRYEAKLKSEDSRKIKGG